MITEVSLGKFCAGACKLVEAAELLRDKRYEDDITYSMMLDKSDGKRKFLTIREDLSKAFKEIGFNIKLVLSTWDTDPDLMETIKNLMFNAKDKKESFLGQEWDLVHNTFFLSYICPLCKSQRTTPNTL